MNRKICSYKNCKSDNFDPLCGDVTFFSFPKDKEKFAIWVKLSGCDVNELESYKFRNYLCSKHFDHHKYMSSNPRRKLLLSTALPFPYESGLEFDDKSEEESDNGFYKILQIGEVFHLVDEEEQGEILLPDVVESKDLWSTSHETTDNDDGDNQQQNDIDEKQESISNNLHCSADGAEIYINNQICHEYPGKKRKMKNLTLESDNLLNGSQKRVKCIPNDKLVISIHGENQNEENVNYAEVENEVVINPEVTTFVDGNVEYIKMPKSVYNKEKRQLMKEIKYYKDILLKFKKQVLDIKL